MYNRGNRTNVQYHIQEYCTTIVGLGYYRTIVQSWPKELVMGCENVSNLCVTERK